MRVLNFSLVLATFLGEVIHAAPVKRSISQELYDELSFYVEYAFSAYSTTCASPSGNTLVTEFSNNLTDTQGFIARDDTRQEIIVSLRGSTTLQDYLTDVDILLVPFEVSGTSPPAGTLAHSGFLTAWNSVASTVLSVVQEQLDAHPGYALVTSGHSLGGSLASLAGITLQQNFPSNSVRMYTYGQVRTGNDVYAFWVNDKFGTNAYRSVHTTDIVPHLIPQAIGYRHHGIEYWENPDPASPENTTQCAADGEDPDCSDSVVFGDADAHLVYYGIPNSTPFCS